MKAKKPVQLVKKGAAPDLLLLAVAHEMADRELPGPMREEMLRGFFSSGGFSHLPELFLPGVVAMLEELGPGLGEAARKCLTEGVPLDMALFAAGVGRSPSEAIKPAYLAKLDKSLLMDRAQLGLKKGGR